MIKKKLNYFVQKYYKQQMVLSKYGLHNTFYGAKNKMKIINQ